MDMTITSQYPTPPPKANMEGWVSYYFFDLIFTDEGYTIHEGHSAKKLYCLKLLEID